MEEAVSQSCDLVLTLWVLSFMPVGDGTKTLEECEESDNVRDVGGEGPQSTSELPCHSLGAMLWRQLASRNEQKMFFLVACFHFWSWQDYDGSGTFVWGKSLLRWMISPKSSVNLWEFHCWTFWVELKKHFHFFFLQLLIKFFLINQHFLCK